MSFSKEYAQALFEIASEKNKVASFKKQAQDVIEIFDSIQDIKDYFKSFAVGSHDKKTIINYLKNDVDLSIINMLNIMVDNKRIASYNVVLNAFIDLCNSYLKIKQGIIFSAHQLSKEHLLAIENKLSGEYKVMLKNEIDSRLISGFKIVLDDKIIDYSTLSKFNQMYEVLKRKEI